MDDARAAPAGTATGADGVPHAAGIERGGAEVTTAGAPGRAGMLTIPVASLIVVAAPIAVAIAGLLAIYDPARRRRWIAMAVIAVLVIVWVPFVFFTEPKPQSVTSRAG